MSADRNVLGAEQLNQLLSLKIKRHWPSFLGLLIFSFPLLGPSNFTLFQSFSLITLEIRAKALMSYPSSLIFGTHLNSHEDLNSSYLQLDVCKFLVYNPSFPLSLSLSLKNYKNIAHKPCCYSASVSPDISQCRSVQWSFETWQIRNWILEFSLLHPFSIFLFCMYEFWYYPSPIFHGLLDWVLKTCLNFTYSTKIDYFSWRFMMSRGEVIIFMLAQAYSW